MERRNAYTCGACGGTMVTVDRDEGTTPFMIACLHTPGCAGLMTSHDYVGPVVDGERPPAYEWRRPSAEELALACPALREHYDMGGLEIHPIH